MSASLTLSTNCDKLIAWSLHADCDFHFILYIINMVEMRRVKLRSLRCKRRVIFRIRHPQIGLVKDLSERLIDSQTAPLGYSLLLVLIKGTSLSPIILLSKSLHTLRNSRQCISIVKRRSNRFYYRIILK